MNGLPAVITVAAILVGIGSLVLIWADERWTRKQQELFDNCRCGECTAARQ